MTVEAAVKPRLRGVIHQWAAIAALIAGVVLTSLTRTARSAVAGGICGALGHSRKRIFPGRPVWKKATVQT
jgi:hypothetical protein